MEKSIPLLSGNEQPFFSSADFWLSAAVNLTFWLADRKLCHPVDRNTGSRLVIIGRVAGKSRLTFCAFSLSLQQTSTRKVESHNNY
jgi:hypothetical protein